MNSSFLNLKKKIFPIKGKEYATFNVQFFSNYLPGIRHIQYEIPAFYAELMALF